MAVELNKIPTITHSGSSSVTTSSSQILAENQRRLYAEITNASTVGCWLAFGIPAVVGVGIYLGPNGFSYIIGPDNMWRGVVNIIAASGSGNVIGTIEGQ